MDIKTWHGVPDLNSGHCKNKSCPFALTVEEQIK